MQVHEPGALQQRLHDGSLPKQQTIANLYSQLQAAMDRATLNNNSNNNNYANSHTHAPHLTDNNDNNNSSSDNNDSLHTTTTSTAFASESAHIKSTVPESCRSSEESGFYSSASTTTSPVTPHPLLTCACHHWLVSVDSEHCGLCDEPLAILQEWQADRTRRFQCIQQHMDDLDTVLRSKREHQSRLHTLMSELKTKEAASEQRSADLDSLRADLRVLDTKYRDELQQIAELQANKELVKHELEELSTRLFEEARHMVAAEQAQSQGLAEVNVRLQAELQKAEQSLEHVEAELAMLRKKETKDHPPPIELDSTTRAQLDLCTLVSSDHPWTVEPSHPDDQCLLEFQQFMDTVGTVSLRKLHNLPFIKTCLTEDIRPALRFGPNPRMASKKIVDAILAKTCLVEPCPPGFAKQQMLEKEAQQSAEVDTITSLWERFATTPTFQGCQACGRDVAECDLTYRFRISYFDEWSCIDRFCRDRLESVIQFYTFVRQLRIGAYHHRSSPELYQELTRLRLQMFMSRMGVLPAMLEGLGLDNAVVGKPETLRDDDNDSARNSIGNYANRNSFDPQRLSSSTTDSAPSYISTV